MDDEGLLGSGALQALQEPIQSSAEFSVSHGVLLTDGLERFGVRKFNRKFDVTPCATGSWSIVDDGLAMAGSLGDCDVPRDHGSEYRLGQLSSHLGLNLVAQREGGIVHCQKDAGYAEVWIEPAGLFDGTD
jgi:hypothetical protein